MTESPHSIDNRIRDFRHLCTRGARKFLRDGIERCDLEQTAAIGLIKAARRFDPHNGAPFEAYAWRMIVGELMHYVRDHERIVRIPRTLRGLERRAVAVRAETIGRLGREPTDAELASAIGASARALDEMRLAFRTGACESLDDADVARDLDRSRFETDDHWLLRIEMSALEQTERRIIFGAYVLGMTHAEIGRRLGMSAKRVSRVKTHALDHLHQSLAS